MIEELFWVVLYTHLIIFGIGVFLMWRLKWCVKPSPVEEIPPLPIPEPKPKFNRHPYSPSARHHDPTKGSDEDVK